MIKILGSIPDKIAVACGCGAESMAIIDFLRRTSREVHVLYVNHGTEFGTECESFLVERLGENLLDSALHFMDIQGRKPQGVSQELFWREGRYFALGEWQRKHECPIITCHHLDDQVETWLWSVLRTGEPKLIPYSREQVIRPFLMTPKQDFINYCQRFGIPYLEDPSNEDTRFTRNYIRHQLVPHALVVNPGLRKVIARKTQEYYDARV